jgi:hypothetical protein
VRAWMHVQACACMHAGACYFARVRGCVSVRVRPSRVRACDCASQWRTDRRNSTGGYAPPRLHVRLDRRALLRQTRVHHKHLRGGRSIRRSSARVPVRACSVAKQAHRPWYLLPQRVADERDEAVLVLRDLRAAHARTDGRMHARAGACVQPGGRETRDRSAPSTAEYREETPCC